MRERLSSVHNPERKFFAVLFAALLLLCVGYGYFLNNAITAVVGREQAIGAIAALDIRLNELEFSYIALQNEIDLEDAYERGFVEAPAPYFVSRSPLPSALSLSAETGSEL